MPWTPDQDLSTGPLAPGERRDVRRVLKWYERKVFFQASIRVWALWLAGLPTFMLAAWELLQGFLKGHVQ